MKEKQAVKVPSYVAKFLDKAYSVNLSLYAIMEDLIEIYADFRNVNDYNGEEEYLNMHTASWVSKVIGDGDYNNLFLLISDIHRNGYESFEPNKMLVIYDTNEDEYLDKYFTLVSMEEAIQFKTKEDAVKFILENYEIREVYVDED